MSKRGRPKGYHPPGIEERNDKIMNMLMKHNAAVVARKFGITRERVRQIYESRGGHPNPEVKHKSDERNELETKYAHLLGTMTDTDLASYLGLPKHFVVEARKNLGIERHKKPVGCDNCEKNEYARGLCKNCYNRALRWGTLDKYHKDHDGTDRRFA